MGSGSSGAVFGDGKQKAALPHGAWLQWVKQHCDFSHDQATRYMAVASLDYARVRNLSLRDALWEVAQQKAEEAEIDEEIAADRAKASKPRRGSLVTTIQPRK